MFKLGFIAWCYINIMLSNGDIHETAVKAKVTDIQGEYLIIDAQEYADEKDYVGNYMHKMVIKDQCLPNEEN